MSAVKLRQHQQDCIDLARAIHTKRHDVVGRKTFSVCVTPGGGKSNGLKLFANEGARLGLWNRVLYITTSNVLRDQARHVFGLPGFGGQVGLSKKPPGRQMSFSGEKLLGSVVNIQTVADAFRKGKTPIAEAMEGARYLLILDEVHHMSADEEQRWGAASVPLREAAEFVVQATGTHYRTDEVAILGAPVVDGKYVHDITYSRADAIRQGAILEVAFHTVDGKAILPYERRSVVLSEAASEDAAKSTMIALNDREFVAGVVEKSITMWREYREQDETSKILFVCVDTDAANRVLKLVRSLGVTADIAHSKTATDEGDAAKKIRSFASNHVEALVTVDMASEGFDCPALTHLVYLSNVTTPLRITQAFGRVLRVNPNGPPPRRQVGHIICLRDTRIVPQIETWLDEQEPAIAERRRSDSAEVARVVAAGGGRRLAGSCEMTEVRNFDERGNALSDEQQHLYERACRIVPQLGNGTITEALMKARQIADLMNSASV
jgi:superfamily II DNA or RNA helicase